MTELELICVDKEYSRTVWVLSLSDDGAVLKDPDDVIRARIRPLDADQSLLVPGFWLSISHLGVVTDDGVTVSFLPKSSHVAEFQRFRAISVAEQIGQLAKQGPRAVNRAKLVALGLILGGVLLVITPIVLVVEFEDMWAALPLRLAKYLIWGTVILGIISVVSGVVNLSRALRAAKQLENNAWSQDME